MSKLRSLLAEEGLLKSAAMPKPGEPGWEEAKKDFDDLIGAMDAEFVGSIIGGNSATRYKDRFNATVEKGHRASYALKFYNPNRGTPFFEFSEQKDLDQIEESFKKLIVEAKQKLQEQNFTWERLNKEFVEKWRS